MSSKLILNRSKQCLTYFISSINLQQIQSHNKSFHTTAFNLVSKQFEDAKARLTTLKDDPGNDAKLKLYALFKQATVGSCNTPKPGMIDFVGRAKWSAWSELGKLSQADAEKQYIDYVNQLCKSSSEETTTINPIEQSNSKFQSIITSIEHGNVYKIVLNRPTKKNAITLAMYKEIQEALKEADSNPNVMICCFTGAGEYYSSGNDLSNFTEGFKRISDVKQMAKEGRDILEDFVNSFINFSKPLVGLINGPSIGISFTLLGLFDLVIASDKATFTAPFSKLAQSPEACSSYTFPRLMGTAKAADILLFNRGLTVTEAYERNLVSQIVASVNFDQNVARKLEEFSKLPIGSVVYSRRLIRDSEKELLRKINKQECDLLMERWTSQEFMNVIANFFKSKSK